MKVVFQVSAYASFFHPDRVEEQLTKMNHTSQEPVSTNFTGDFCGTLDYIFYTGILNVISELLPYIIFVILIIWFALMKTSH